MANHINIKSLLDAVKTKINKYSMFDFLLIPLVFIAAIILKKVRHIGINNLPKVRRVLINIGVFPILNHYYEPQFDYQNTTKPFSDDRILSGINWNVKKQIKHLELLKFSEELLNLDKDNSPYDFDINNSSFCSGDFEFWYQLIRLLKPKRIFEIGSGQSTLMAIRAIKIYWKV